MKKKFEVSTDGAMIFSAIMVTIFTVVMIIMYWKFQSVPDALIVAFFAGFGAEGGYCTYIYKTKKKNKEEDLDEGRIDQIDS